MIYTVCEWIATISECMILFWFLITTLSYKEISVSKRFIGSTIFFVLLNAMIFTFNYWYIIEGWYIYLYYLAFLILSIVTKTEVLASRNCNFVGFCMYLYN